MKGGRQKQKQSWSQNERERKNVLRTQKPIEIDRQRETESDRRRQRIRIYYHIRLSMKGKGKIFTLTYFSSSHRFSLFSVRLVYYRCMGVSACMWIRKIVAFSFCHDLKATLTVDGGSKGCPAVEDDRPRNLQHKRGVLVHENEIWHWHLPG